MPQISVLPDPFSISNLSLHNGDVPGENGCMVSDTRITVSTEALQLILNAVPVPMFVKDRSHGLVLVNDALCQLRGRSREEMVGPSDRTLPREQREVFWQKDDEVFATGRPNENEEVLTDGNGALRVIVTHKRLIVMPTAAGDQPFIIGTISDVTQFREAEVQARYLGQLNTPYSLTPRNGAPAGAEVRYDPNGWDIAADLREALASDQLSLAFQPLVAAGNGQLRGFEALVRWKHPVRGIIEPGMFIPVAERTGLVVRLGEMVLHKACAAAATWPWPVRVAVNVSPAQLERDDLPATVQSALSRSGLPAARLELEVTESALIAASVRNAASFAQLKALGVSLTLDDFGAGWSSLATLQQFRFDRIKIDRGFISHIETDTRSVAIVRAVLHLAQMLAVPVTAEGVEAWAQVLSLRQMGCSELQGHYIGRPAAQAALPDRSQWLD